MTMMLEGTQASNYVTHGNWEALPAAIYAGPNTAYYNKTKLDLRGLLASKERGLEVSNVILQDAGEIRMVPSVSGEGHVFCVDLLTTVEPTEENMADWWRGISVPGSMPGFTIPTNALNDPPSEQSFNPSQILWGLWRLIAVDRNFVLGGTDLAMRTVNSGYFGEGETLVAPALWWTRLCVTNTTLNQIIVPSSNCIIRAQAIDLSMPQEITAMIRAAQR